MNIPETAIFTAQYLKCATPIVTVKQDTPCRYNVILRRVRGSICRGKAISITYSCVCLCVRARARVSSCMLVGDRVRGRGRGRLHARAHL